MREMREAEKRGEPYSWGNVAELSEGAIKELGIAGAISERNRASSHVASSGESATMPRKVRKEHYTRKIAKYKAHEDERRVRWERRHPGAPESNWERREMAHREKRDKMRKLRRALTRRKSSSNNSRKSS